MRFEYFSSGFVVVLWNLAISNLIHQEFLTLFKVDKILLNSVALDHISEALLLDC